MTRTFPFGERRAYQWIRLELDAGDERHTALACSQGLVEADPVTDADSKQLRNPEKLGLRARPRGLEVPESRRLRLK